MKKLKVLILRWQISLVFLLITCLFGKGQENSGGDYISDPDYIGPVLSEKSDPNVLITPEIRKLGFSFNTGMMFGTAGHKNYFAIGYAAPAVAYNLTSTLRIRAGSIIFFNPFMNAVATSPQQEVVPTFTANNIALFVAADYFVTDRFTLTGTYYKMPENDLFQRNNIPEVYNRYQAPYRIPSESMSLGLNYKITKGFTIGAEVRFSNHDQSYWNPYLLNPGYPQYNSIYW